MQYEIWNIRDFDADAYDTMYAAASPERQERADRFRFPDDRMRCLCAQSLARRMLAIASGVSPEQITFTYGERGKPEANLPFYFNLSHSGDFVLCAVSEKPIGVDIEQIKPFRAGLITRWCSQGEAEFIRGSHHALKDSVTDPEVCARFYRVWTAKEAYAKMTGKGISTDLTQICYVPEKATVCGLPLTQIEAPEGYVASILESDL